MFILYTVSFTMSDASKLKEVKDALTEYHQNYKDIPIVHTVLSQLLDIVRGEEAHDVAYDIQTNLDASLFSILPYSLWPSSK